MKQNALVAIDKGDFGFATAGRCKARIMGEIARIRVKLANIDHAGTCRSIQYGKFPAFAGSVVGQGDGAFRVGHEDPQLKDKLVFAYAAERLKSD